MELLMLFMVLCIIVVTPIGKTNTIGEVSVELVAPTDVISNDEVNTMNQYSEFLTNSLKRRIILLLDDGIIIENKSTILVQLLCKLRDMIDTTEFIDEYPEINNLIFKFEGGFENG